MPIPQRQAHVREMPGQSASSDAIEVRNVLAEAVKKLEAERRAISVLADSVLHLNKDVKVIAATDQSGHAVFFRFDEVLDTDTNESMALAKPTQLMRATYVYSTKDLDSMLLETQRRYRDSYSNIESMVFDQAAALRIRQINNTIDAIQGMSFGPNKNDQEQYAQTAPDYNDNNKPLRMAQ